MGSYSAHRPVRERKSGIPLSVETPAPVRTTQGCASRISAASSALNAGDEVAERRVFERLDEEIGGGEVELGRNRVRHRDAEDPRGHRGGDAVRRVLDGDRLLGGDTEALERLLVEHGAGLAALAVAVGAQQELPALGDA